MHVKDTPNGRALVDEPMRVEGEAAERIVADLDRAPSEESRRFQEEARGVYERVQGSLSV